MNTYIAFISKFKKKSIFDKSITNIYHGIYSCFKPFFYPRLEFALELLK